MYYFEVLVADNKYQADEPLTYNFDGLLQPGTVVSIPLRGRIVSGFVSRRVDKPKFNTLPIKTILSDKVLPAHVIDLAFWLKRYYASTLGDALRQFAPSRTIRRSRHQAVDTKYVLNQPLISKANKQQLAAIELISSAKSGTYLLHGQTGSGKTYVYGELIKKTLLSGKSAVLLVPEIALTSQIAGYMKNLLDNEIIVFHSHLSVAQRKKLWFKILEANEPLLVMGPRSALFTPLNNIGVIVVDESHEQAYKQEQSPRYHAVRVASQLAKLTGAKAILGSATPNVVDYYLAEAKQVVINMDEQARKSLHNISTTVVDMKDSSQLSSQPFITKPMIKALEKTLGLNQQALIYLNRRGTARLVMCSACGWQLICPNCDTPLVYHGDEHRGICHGCGYNSATPSLCPVCKSPDIVYKSVGTKAVAESLARIFPNHQVARFDGDNKDGERFEQRYQDVVEGKIDIIVGTQIISKGLDLPKLGMVGLVIAETALYLPDYMADERTFQIIYQLIGRVGRGHSDNKPIAIVQTYEPDSTTIKSAVKRDWQSFYRDIIDERRQYRFPPFCHILKLSCRRKTAIGAEKATRDYFNMLSHSLPSKVQIIGPMPSFYYRRAGNYYWQIIVKSKQRAQLEEIASEVPAGWIADLDPIHLL